MTVSGLCQCAGISKQAFYKAERVRQARKVDEDLVLKLVIEVRQRHQRLGARKLLWMIRPELEKAGVAIGRNKLLALLRRKGLLVPRKRRSARTTDSRHRFRVYTNLLRTAQIAGPHQAWVTDLTYIRTPQSFVFAVFVMDVFSRKIVGFDVSDSLEAAGCLRAAKQAMAQLPKGARPIHHSDRGTQYCCEEYVNLLARNKLAISMTEVNHCYENSMAERLNGILKQEYGLGETLANLKEARLLVRQAVMLYNLERPHLALDYATPEQVHTRINAA